MKYYLGGPMTTKENWNYPLFRSVAENLRQRFMDVVSPHELNPPGHVPGENPWQEYVRRDLMEMLKCDALILLPDWQHSRGTRLELIVANEINLYVFELTGPEDEDHSNWDKLKETPYGNQDKTKIDVL